MAESSRRRGRSSTASLERSFKSKRFGTIVRALWPHKPALNLAQRIGCSERAALFYINGQRKVTARCVRLIVNEID